MAIKNIFFSKKNDPANFIQIAETLIAYFLFLKDSGHLDFDKITFTLNKSDLKSADLHQLKDPAFKNVLANELLKHKSAAIRKYHKGITPTLFFKEDVGLNQIITSLKGKDQLLTFYYYLGGDNDTLLIEGFKKMKLDAAGFYSFFRSHCEYLQPDYGYLADSTISKHQKLPEYFFGWMSYFSNHIALPSLPADYDVEAINNTGRLLITTKEEFDPANDPTQYEKAMRLVELFRQYHIVRPL